MRSGHFCKGSDWQMVRKNYIENCIMFSRLACIVGHYTRTYFRIVIIIVILEILPVLCSTYLPYWYNNTFVGGAWSSLECLDLSQMYLTTVACKRELRHIWPYSIVFKNPAVLINGSQWESLLTTLNVINNNNNNKNLRACCSFSWKVTFWRIMGFVPIVQMHLNHI